MHLLIADDMTTQRLVLSLTLTKLGYTFVAAEDGKEAFGFFQKEYFPVVITDWQMPNMDGLELCRMIRAEPYERYTYVVVLTTLDSKVNYLEALEAGADDFLVKPYDEDLLAAHLLVGQRIGALLSEIKQLRGFVPICPSCKKVRAEGDQWIEVRQFLSTHTKADVVQGTCPSCNSIHQEADRQLRRKLGRV